MAQVYEGILQNSASSKKTSDTINLLSLRGEIFQNGQQIETPKQFHFYDLNSQKVYRVNKADHAIVLEKKLTQLANYEAGKMYFARKQKWIPVSVPQGSLPEIQLVRIASDQQTLDLNHSPKDIVIPIQGSDFSEVIDPLPLDIFESQTEANLAYMLIHFQKGSKGSKKIVGIEVRVIYKLLFKEVPQKLVVPPLLALEPPPTFGAPARRIYFADERGDFSVTLESGKQCLKVSGTSMLACIQQQITQDGLKLLFRHRVTGNSDLPKNLSLIPSSQFENLILYEARDGQVYRGQRLLHRESFSEILRINYLDSEDSEVNQDVLVQYGSLFDKMITVELVYRAHQLTNLTLDCTSDLQKLLPGFLSLPESLDFYYLSSYKGFDLKNSEKNKGRLVVKLNSPLLSGKIYDLVRRVIIKGTLRPIELRIKILPTARKSQQN